MKSHEVVLCNPLRTGIGFYGGSLKTVPATDLGTTAIKGVLERSKLDPKWLRVSLWATSFRRATR